jgi:Zn-dependent M28 family amino/carboxypeptidase
VFVGFTDEERGEIGSRFYAQKMTKQEVSVTDAMVNMDTLGLAPTEIWGSHSDKRLIGALLYVAEQLKLTATGVNVEQVGSTDSEQFAKRNIPRITIHSLTQQSWSAGILHSEKDKLSALQLGDYYQTYQLLSAYLAFLDAALTAPEASSSHR